MKKILVVVDMQNDFITGPLGTPEAVSIVDKVVEKIRGEEWDYLFVTKDTHDDYNYFDTQEGRKLPIEHCIRNSYGWRLQSAVHKAIKDSKARTIQLYNKSTFGSVTLARNLRKDIEAEFTLVGVCTDICVISNALLLKAYYPEMRIVVDAACCAGSTPEKHRMALEVMKSCQVEVVNYI